MTDQRLLIEMGIGWTRNKKNPRKLTSATPGEYAAEIERLRAALTEIVRMGGQDLCRGIAAEALRDDVGQQQPQDTKND